MTKELLAQAFSRATKRARREQRTMYLAAPYGQLRVVKDRPDNPLAVFYATGDWQWAFRDGLKGWV